MLFILKCKFNSKIHCSDIGKECLKCIYRRNSLLSKFLGINEYDSSEVDNKKVMLCPFCLHMGKFSDYIQENSKLLRCPECENRFYVYTLIEINKLLPDSFAIWIWKYPRFEFWRRCKIQLFYSRLKEYGMYDEFINAYHSIRDMNFRED